MGGNLNLYEATKDTIGYKFIGYEPGLYGNNYEPSFSDGKLEFATFESLLDLIMNKGKFITQESGPFEFEFHSHKDIVTYLNVDGEFYMLNNPIAIILNKAESIVKNGSARVLTNSRDKVFEEPSILNVFSKS